MAIQRATAANPATTETIIEDLRDALKRDEVKPKVGTELGKDEFMKLLIAQLKNQDPLSPMDDKEFISQQAQFSSLEQMTNMNKNFEAFIKSMQADRGAYAVSYLGTTVTLADPESEAGAVTGRVTEIRYKDGAPRLVVGDREFELSALSSIKV